MHRDISNYNESCRENGKTNNVIPQSAIIESECAENRCAGDFDVEAVFVIDQGEVFDFIDNEAFEPVVED